MDKSREFEVYGRHLGTNFPEWGICTCPPVTDELILLREVLPITKTDEELAQKYMNEFGKHVNRHAQYCAFLAGIEAERNRVK